MLQGWKDLWFGGSGQLRPIYVLFFFLISPLLNAQSTHQHVSQLPLLVDGAQSPENIPDEVAYRHFIVALAYRHDDSTEALRRRDAYLSHLALSESDRGALLNALVDVRERLDVVDQLRISESAAAQAGDANAAQKLASLQVEEQSILAGARRAIPVYISPEGAAIVDGFVKEHIKRCVKIYQITPK